LHNIDNSFDPLRLTVIEGRNLGAKQSRALDDGDQHAGPADVEGENGGARCLVDRIEPRQALTDQFPITGPFQRHVFGDRHLHGVGRQLAKGRMTA
jgi:hypothetical protein